MDASLVAESGGGSAPYSHLSDRAVAFVREHGGSVTEDALVAYVFGASGTPALWQSLLRQLLGAESRLLLRPDGRWSLAQPIYQSDARTLSDFVAIDVETTGLQPLRQRVIEIALVRYSSGAPNERFTTLVNPDKRIPKFISTLTTITNEMVAEAPRFAEIAVRVEEFLEGALLVGHNVGFDIGFINAELGRAGRPQLINERIDTMGLAARLIPGLRRPSLDKVATQLGFSPRKIHRAEVDAELAGNVALQLAVKANDLGIDTVDRLRAIGKPTDHSTTSPVGRGRSLLDRSLLADIPKRPGVYLMRDVNDRIIYVGKAKCLRDRVSSYFSQPLGYTRKMDGLLESVARIEVEETGSELGALLLESQLIRRYQPRYNVVMRASEEYPFIRVDLAHSWPRVTLAKAIKDDGSVYFGPFKSRKAARTAIELVNDNFPLRTCPRSFKTPKSYGAPCLRLDMGRCLGPCVGRADRDQYLQYVHDAVAFLDGEDERLLDRMHRELEISAGKLDYERARKLRNNIQLLQNLVGFHRRLKQARERNTLLIVQPAARDGARSLMLVVRGHLWSIIDAGTDESSEKVAERLAGAWQRYREAGLRPVDHHTLDDAVILNRWIDRADGSEVLIRFAETDSPLWSELANRALAIDSKTLDLPFTAVVSDDETTATEPAAGPELASVPAAITAGADLVEAFA